MEFMLLFLERRGAPGGGPEGFAEMGKLARELASAGKLRRGGPLHPEAGAVRVTDGPFAESKEVLGGFWVVDVASREEALDIARRCPHARHGLVEVHGFVWRQAHPDSGRGPVWMYEFRIPPRTGEPPDPTRVRQMLEFGDQLAKQERLLDFAPLAAEPPPARVETRNGRLVVTDGPFAEAKELLGGYALLHAADRAEAVEIGKRFPHAKWGPVVVREMMFLDRT